MKRPTILVPIDFSQESPLILRAAEEEAVKTRYGVLLLHVVGDNSTLSQRPPVILTDPLEDCTRHLERVPSHLISVLAVEGEPIDQILRVAAREHCPTIVMGRGGSRTRAGHVAEAVEHRFPHRVRLISQFDAEPQVAAGNPRSLHVGAP